MCVDPMGSDGARVDDLRRVLRDTVTELKGVAQKWRGIGL